MRQCALKFVYFLFIFSLYVAGVLPFLVRPAACRNSLTNGCAFSILMLQTYTAQMGIRAFFYNCFERAGEGASLAAVKRVWRPGAGLGVKVGGSLPPKRVEPRAMPRPFSGMRAFFYVTKMPFGHFSEEVPTVQKQPVPAARAAVSARKPCYARHSAATVHAAGGGWRPAGDCDPPHP